MHGVVVIAGVAIWLLVAGACGLQARQALNERRHGAAIAWMLLGPAMIAGCLLVAWVVVTFMFGAPLTAG